MCVSVSVFVCLIVCTVCVGGVLHNFPKISNDENFMFQTIDAGHRAYLMYGWERGVEATLTQNTVQQRIMMCRIN